jgi:hypothetical protein
MSEKFEKKYSPGAEKENAQADSSINEPETEKKPVFASREQELIHELIGLHPDMNDPVKFAQSIDTLNLEYESKDRFRISGKYRGHDVQIQFETTYPSGGFIDFTVDRTYYVSIDGTEITNPQDAKEVSEYFRQLTKARKEWNAK